MKFGYDPLKFSGKRFSQKRKNEDGNTVWVRVQGIFPIDQSNPRNKTCPCGSGKRFKHCHGKGRF